MIRDDCTCYINSESFHLKDTKFMKLWDDGANEITIEIGKLYRMEDCEIYHVNYLTVSNKYLDSMLEK